MFCPGRRGVAALALALLGLMPATAQATAAHGGAPLSYQAGARVSVSNVTVPCHTVILEGGLLCYPPRSQRQAEVRLAVRPIAPNSIIEHATHLRLTQLRLFFGFNTSKGVNLLYGFGSPCWSSYFTCPRHYLVVGEAPGSGSPPAIRIVRDRSIRNGVTTWGPWKFIALVPGRNLLVTVYGTYPKATIAGIGEKIVSRKTL